MTNFDKESAKAQWCFHFTNVSLRLKSLSGAVGVEFHFHVMTSILLQKDKEKDDGKLEEVRCQLQLSSLSLKNIYGSFNFVKQYETLHRENNSDI